MIKNPIRATAEYVAGSQIPDKQNYCDSFYGSLYVSKEYYSKRKQWLKGFVTLSGLRQDLSIGHPIGRRLVGRPFPKDEPMLPTVNEELYGIDRCIALEQDRTAWLEERSHRIKQLGNTATRFAAESIDTMFSLVDFHRDTGIPVSKPTPIERAIVELGAGLGVLGCIEKLKADN